MALHHKLTIGLYTICAVSLAGAFNVRVDDGPAGSAQESPYLALDPTGDLHATWVDQREGGRDVRHSRSADGGLSWSGSVRANDAQGKVMAGFQNGPQLVAISTDTLVVVWSDTRNSYLDADVVAAHSQDGGLTWSAATRVNDDTVVAFNFMPSLVDLGAGSVAVVWLDERGHGSDIYFSRSSDLGVTWSANVRAVVQDTGEPCDCCLPHLVAGPDQSLLLAFRNNIDNVRDIHLTRSTDGGVSWLAPVRIADAEWEINACPTSGPALGILGQELLVSWMDRSSGQPAIYADRSSDFGLTFGSDISIDAPAGAGTVDRPVIATWGETVHVAYRSTVRDVSDVLIARSDDRGATWTTLGYLSDAPEGSRESEVELLSGSDGTPLAVWTDTRDENAGDIYFGAGIATGIAGRSPSLPLAVAGAQLLAPHPNPFNPRTTIPFELANHGEISLAIYDLRGALVRVLDDDTHEAGFHAATWDGTNEAGQAVATGVYVVRLQAGGVSDTRRIVLIK